MSQEVLVAHVPSPTKCPRQGNDNVLCVLGGVCCQGSSGCRVCQVTPAVGTSFCLLFSAVVNHVFWDPPFIRKRSL